MKFFSALLSAAALALTAACAQTPAATAAADTRDADAKAIRALEAQWNQEYVAKDVSKLISHYTDDATLMGPGMPASKGTAAIRTTLTGMVADPALSLKFDASRVEVSKSGDIGYAEGAYTMTMTNPATKKPMQDKGSYVTVYKKQADGSWKAVSDIATSEAPPAIPGA